MLHRNVNGGYLAISQPAHAWVSGQIAAHWGNEITGDIEPRQDVILAAEQHDIGWLEWEARPTLNPDNGRPRTFRDLPTSEHVSVWDPAGPRSLVYGPYVALLVSMHGTGLYQSHDYTRDIPEEARAARRFVEGGAEFETALLDGMRHAPEYAEHCDDRTLARNRRLIAVWDAMSLFLCGGLTEARAIHNVPAQNASITLKLTPDGSHSDVVRLTPWPFRAERIDLACAGRLLTETFSDQEAMRVALAAALWLRLQIVLKPDH